MVGKKTLFELKRCTVSGLKRQFDKWHLFRAPTPPPPNWLFAQKPLRPKPPQTPDFPENPALTPQKLSGKSKGGLSKGGLGPKGAKKGPFGAISALPPWLWGAEELVPIGPEKAPIGPEKVPICPEKARFRRKDFPRFSLKIWGLSPPL